MTDAPQLGEVAGRHGFSQAAGNAALDALEAGGGTQAQFNHPELGGMGQWSRGGMIMIGDMFNSQLKAKVTALFDDLQPLVGAGTPSSQDGAPRSGSRWPQELGRPSSSGSQNDMHYAVFPDTRRLSVEHGGKVTVYDTGDHHIGGASQQQGGTQSLRFSTASGTINVNDLRVVDAETPAEPALPDAAPDAAGDDALGKLERLHILLEKRAITDEEFGEAKRKLMSQI